MNRKSQTEILGVLVIVIILIVAGVFMISLRLRKTAAPTQDFADPEFAQSFLNALMNTKTEKNVILADIIKDCYSTRNDLCGTATTADCCEYAQKTIANALDATLGKWKKSYRLTVSKGGDIRIPTEGGPDAISNDIGCNDYAEQFQPGSYPIPPPPPIIVTLQICKD